MSVHGLEQAIPAGHRILLDASALIAYFNRREQVSPVAEHVIDTFVHSGRNEATVSMVTAMEVLVRPLMRGPADPYLHVVDFLSRFPHLHAAPIDLPVAQEAASLRATHRLAPPDTLTIGTGLVHQVGYLVTNDRAWAGRLRPIEARIKVCYLADYLPFP